MFENFNEELNKELSGQDFKDAIESLKDLDDKTKAIIIMAAGAGVAVTVGATMIGNGIKKAFSKKKDKAEEKKAEPVEKVQAEVVEEPKKEEASKAEEAKTETSGADQK